IARRGPGDAAGARGRVRLGRGGALRGRPGPGFTRRPSGGIGCVAARRFGPPEADARLGGAARPRLRHARRREGHGERRPRSPPDPATRAVGLQAVRGASRERSSDSGSRAEGGGVTPRVTPLALSVVSLAACGLVFGIFTGRPELVVTVVPLVFCLFRRSSLGWADGLTPRALWGARSWGGERVGVPSPGSAGGPARVRELFEPLPPSLRLVAGSNRGFFTLVRDQSVSWTYEVECRRRGRASLGVVHARLWDRAGLQAVDSAAHASGPLRVYPRRLPLRRLPRPRQTQTSVGNYVASSVGQGLEPGDIREFVPSDRIRHVNWRASLRFRKLFVTQYHQERNADVILMLDTLSEAGAAPETTLDASVRAAASLAGAYLARKDRVGL